MTERWKEKRRSPNFGPGVIALIFRQRLREITDLPCDVSVCV